MYEKTHAELVERAGRWLRNTQRCGVVFTELASYAPETPDAIGWKGSFSIKVECKTSRRDFFADINKVCNRGGVGMGNQRYFMTNPGLIAVDDLYDGWGLLEVRNNHVKIIAKATSRLPDNGYKQHEMRLMYSELRLLQMMQIGVHPRDGKRVQAIRAAGLKS